ncbi:hypothetical protein [Acidithiobacillus sp.]
MKPLIPPPAARSPDRAYARKPGGGRKPKDARPAFAAEALLWYSYMYDNAQNIQRKKENIDSIGTILQEFGLVLIDFTIHDRR